MNKFKLGRRPMIAPKAAMKFRNYQLKNFPDSPPEGDYSLKAAAALSQMYLNDQYGCHDEKTEVLTETGWCKWPAYDGVIPLATMNQLTGNLEFQTPLAVQRKHHTGPMYFSDHKYIDFALTPGHRMFFKPYIIPYPYVAGGARYGEYSFDTIGAITNNISRFAIPSTTIGWVGADIRKIRIGEREWDGDDFLRLVAIILSDGYVSHGETNRGRIGFCAFRDGWAPKIKALAERLGINEQPSRPGVFYFTDFALAEWLRANGCGRALDKRTPALIKQLSMRQINIFLEFFGDQSSESVGQFYSSSKGMIDDLQELLLRVGIRGSLYTQEARQSHFFDEDGIRKEIISKGPAYTLNKFQSKKHIGFQNLERHKQIIDDWYDGEVFCATVPNSTLVTRRNDSILVSGNCCVISWMAHAEGIFSGNATGTPTIFSGDEITHMYEVIGNFDPADPTNTDNGCDEGTALDYWLHYGFAGRKIAGFLAIDATNQQEIQDAIWLFETVMYGVGLPDDWVKGINTMKPGFTWDVAGNSNVDNGHCFGGMKWGAKGIGISTWGMLGTCTWTATAQYAINGAGGQLFTVLSPEIIDRASQRAPSGFNWDQLVADANGMGASI